MKKLTTCLVVSGLALSGCASISGGGSKCSLENAKYTLTANKLISTYESNPVVFDSQYKGTCVAVTGAPIEISTTAGYSITLAPYSNNTEHKRHKYTYNDNGPTILAKISEEEAKNLSGVRVKGALIRMTGFIGGSFDGIYVGLNDAKLDPTFSEEDKRRIARQNLGDISKLKNQRLAYAQNHLSELEKAVKSHTENFDERIEECYRDKEEYGNFAPHCQDTMKGRKSIEDGTYYLQKDIQKTTNRISILDSFNPSACDPSDYLGCFRRWEQTAGRGRS